MEKKLEKLSSITAPVCVTLILRTHKTHPENKQDNILLKNLISETTVRLENEFGKEISHRYTEKLNKLAIQIDHNQNDNGLLLFVNDDIEEYLRLPLKVNTRVIIDNTFATRPIIRSLKKSTDYLLLILTRNEAKLIEASTNKVIQEITTDGFPITNTDVTSNVNSFNQSSASKVRNIKNEFFNRVDKQVNKIRHQKSLPVVVCAENSNYTSYLEQADYPNTILGHLPLVNNNESSSNLVQNIWPEISSLIVSHNRARVKELESALNSGKFLSDINEVWTAINEGKGRTLFVEEGYFQAVKNENGVLTPINSNEISSKEDIDDIIDEMIEQTIKFGGDVVFLEEGSLAKFNKFALVTRY